MNVPVLENEEVQVHPHLDMLLNPFRTMQGVFEYISGWFFTRKVSTFIAFSPVILLFSTVLALVFNGWITVSSTISQNISDLVDDEFEKSDRQNKTNDDEFEDDRLVLHDSSLAPKEISPYAEMLMRRLVQNESDDVRWKYLVALKFGQRKRLGLARQMMRQLAPENTHGFAPAHAWMAVDTVSRKSVEDRADVLTLINDLEVAMAWSGSGPALHALLADLLEKEGRVADAIKILEGSAAGNPVLLLQMVGISAKHGRPLLAESSATEATKILQTRIAEYRAKVPDFITYIKLCLVLQSPDQAVRVATEGVSRFAEDKDLRRWLSESYRAKYISTFKVSASGGLECDINQLDAALKADPTNPHVSEEVARLLTLGSTATKALTDALEEQLSAGIATTMTHLLLANEHLKSSKFDQAVPHLEVALRQTPDSPVILNNLAVALVRLSADNAGRARELIARGLSISGPDAELLDSQGEIRMMGGDYVGAVESFEAAIGLDGNRIATRQRLVQAYEKAGLADMAKVQQKQIEKLQSELQKTPSDEPK